MSLAGDQKRRLDVAVVALGLVPTRSQAESYIRLGKVLVNGQAITKPGALVRSDQKIALNVGEQYVSRAGLKLASIAKAFDLDFRGKTVLDVGSSTGGFTDFALRRGAKKVIAVELGRGQMHPSLRGDQRIELHEQTDIRNFKTPEQINIVLADVSFVSLRQLLPHVLSLCEPDTQLVVMVKPQFEAAASNLKHKGVIKNERVRRDILHGFEEWAKQYFVVRAKADSQVAGAKGNRERFYLLNPATRAK